MKALAWLVLIVISSPSWAFRVGEPSGFSQRLTEAALEQTRHLVLYDSQYRQIPYPMGDVPANVGVCTDVVVRAYRKQGIDLQQDVHQDMVRHFGLYPKKWRLTKTDTNIDHRRVPNLQVFFSRHGLSLPISERAADYLPGDLVTWQLPQGQPHIGIVSDVKSADGQGYQIVHNIGWGPKLEDMLFDYKITGHYRYYGKLASKTTK